VRVLIDEFIVVAPDGSADEASRRSSSRHL
jgi:hypothetical protein